MQHAKRMDNALREVDVEKVEVERGLHKSCRDGDRVDHVLREVAASTGRFSIRAGYPRDT